VKPLAERIERLLRDRVLAREMGTAGRARAALLFSHEKHAGDLCALLETVVERRRRRS
jgi:glycosyltransferase involved in cell wall biosynthesis